MRRVTYRMRPGPLAAAAAIAVAALVAGPAPESAAACKYEFPGTFVLNQDNGFRVEFPATGRSINATATSYNNRQEVANTGTALGSIQGDKEVQFSITWSGGDQGVYNGEIGENGKVWGQTWQSRNLEFPEAVWNSVTLLTCVQEAPPPQQQQPPPQQQTPPQQNAPPEQLTAKVNADVDVYDVPGGEGNIIDVLRKGDVVPIPRPCPPEVWCEVTGKGWVWGNFLQPKP